MSVIIIISADYQKLFTETNRSESNSKVIKENLRDIILLNYHNEGKDFYTNCECGVPLWCAEIICDLKKTYNIGLHIAVPYEDQAKDWQEEWRDIYFRVHEEADSVKLISKKHTDTCYEEADKYMARKSDFIMIFGDSSEDFSIDKYAKKKGLGVFYIDSGRLLGIKV